MANERITVRDNYGKILGFIEISPNGDKRVLDKNYKIKGFYRKGNNTTTDFYGRIVARGDHASMLINL